MYYNEWTISSIPIFCILNVFSNFSHLATRDQRWTCHVKRDNPYGTKRVFYAHIYPHCNNKIMCSNFSLWKETFIGLLISKMTEAIAIVNLISTYISISLGGNDSQYPCEQKSMKESLYNRQNLVSICVLWGVFRFDSIKLLIKIDAWNFWLKSRNQINVQWTYRRCWGFYLQENLNTDAKIVSMVNEDINNWLSFYSTSENILLAILSLLFFWASASLIID